MIEFKNNWQVKSLGEVADVIAGQSPPSSTYNYNKDGLPFFQGKVDFGIKFPKVRVWCNDPVKIAYPNDILISVRAPVGPTNICDVESCIGRGLSSIRARDNSFYKYIFYFLRSIEHRVSDQGRGSTFNAITQSELREIKIPLPPLPIQKQIAEILEKADEAKQKRKEANKLTDEFLQSVFIEMFGDPVKNPRGWNVKKIKGISSLVTSGSTPLGGNLNYISNGILFIRSQNVLMNRIDYSDIVFIDESIHKRMLRTWVKRNDVLFNITGASIGRVAYFNGENDSANVNQHVCIIRTIKDNVNHIFLSYLISSDSFQSRVIYQNAGATRQAFNFEQIKNFDIILPPLSLQQQFAELVNKTEALKEKQKQSEQELEKLFQSLMQKAFKGELKFSAPIYTLPEVKEKRLTSTDLHAGIIGKIIKAHSDNPKYSNTLGHVKAEKISHLIESHYDIDLGRNPKRIAAGPADFPHLKKVEHRARMKNWFTVLKREDENGYKYKPGKSIDYLLRDVSAELGEIESLIDKIIKKFVNLRTDHSEVIVTVYAAWNDLLLDGKNPTDDEVVDEARENWTPEKLKFEKAKFYGCIEWLRRNNLMPAGKGKRTII